MPKSRAILLAVAFTFAMATYLGRLFYIPKAGTWVGGFWMTLFCSVVAVTALAGFAWVSGRRPLGHCASCCYDLTGNMSGICPECGTKISGQSESLSAC